MTEEARIVCPLCPLACDDVIVNSSGQLMVDGCEIASQFTMSSDRGDTDSVLASLPKRPWQVVTTGADLVTARSLLDLQASSQIDLAIESDPSVEAMLQSASRDGMIAATLAEVATRSDLIWLIGNAEQAYPRIAQKLRLNSAASPHVIRQQSISAEQLAAIASNPQELWQDSSYASLLIGPGAFLTGEEAISSTMVSRLTRLRNETARATTLTMDAAATLRSVSLWTRNHIPGDSQDISVDVRLGTPISTHAAPAKIQIGGHDPGPDQADAYIASSIAGLHKQSMIIRGDGSISLALSTPIASDLSSSSAVLQRLLSQHF
ncbi:hypothetical protein SAMN06265222_101368 [Neorhodopirellula lusitana]|uniref:Formylmethanofuran dehydrogenase subunit B n=1 Tax=Neorhodopirellula lusitana TaxID=445327 RepID=A0ABY1PNQ3_9BACT|nr:formylmethanofuran dehydrogenase [Neorhodopirellula lusitana]SMP39840.1 hypothetical protein SAMN06265222_101368 [Neorhodopirellula lusitana]